MKSNNGWALGTPSQDSKECPLKAEIDLTLLKVMLKSKIATYFLRFFK